MQWGEISNFFLNKTKLLYTQAKENEIGKIKQKLYSQARAYDRVYKVIKETYNDKELIVKNKIDKLNITEHMKCKIKYYFEHPDKMPVFSKNKENNKKDLIKNLTKIMGIGNTKANELVDRGLNNINQITQKKYKELLPEQTKTYLSVKPIEKIPRKVVTDMKSFILGLSKEEIIIVGSYRRGAKFLNDIDIMVVSDDKKILEKIIKSLNNKSKKGDVYPYISGENKLSVLLKWKGKFYKLDFFRTPKRSKWAMLLYSTGSKENNIKMRGRAKTKGFLLNQNGLYNRKTKKLLNGNIKNENYFFYKLGLEYKEPKDR